ncbi:MAG TPA: hypothetical protein VKA36_01360 [Solirubrobacterales bacterium]|nr:hypothetical protein [Solirubrobacterales bacterium]
MTEEPPQNPEPGPEPPADADAPVSGGTGIAPEVSRRVSSILDAVEGEAGRLREDAREEARRYLDYSRRRADALVAERQRRISELSDDIVFKAEAVVGRLEDAAPVREGFENLVRALGDAAERLSRETERTRPQWEPSAFHDEAAADPVAAGPAQQQPPAPPPPPGPARPPSPPAVAQTPATVPSPDRSRSPGPPGEQPHPARSPQRASTPAAGQPPLPPPPGAQAPPMRPTGEGAVDDAKLVAIQMAASGRTRQEVREHLHSAMAVTDTRQLLDEVFGAGSAEDARVPWTAFPR